MATHENFIVAVELGSSKVSAVAGEKQPDGAVRILAFAQEPSETFIRKGRIYNIDKFGQCLSRLKEKLERGVGMSVAKAYVGIGGMGMHTILNSITKQYPDRVKVTEQMIDVLQDENNGSQPIDRDIIGVVPQEYKLDAHRTDDPVGILTQSLTGNFLNIVAAAQTKQQIIDNFAQCRIEVVDLPVTFLSLADNMVSARQRQSGCVFVDMGAQTTSVAIFKGGLLRHLAVIPLGGGNITTDIATAYQIDEAEAEEIKLKYNFGMEYIDEEDKEIFTTSDGREYPLNDLKKLVSARLEEIILNVKYQIDLSQYKLSQLMSGIVLTGGVAKTGGIDSAFKLVTDIQSPVLVSRGLKLTYRTGKQDFNKDGSYDCAISLIDKGNENCCGGPVVRPTDIFSPQIKPEKPAEQPVAPADPQKPATTPVSEDGRIRGGDIAAGMAQEKEATTEEQPKKTSKLKAGFGRFANWAKGGLTKLVSEDD